MVFYLHVQNHCIIMSQSKCSLTEVISLGSWPTTHCGLNGPVWILYPVQAGTDTREFIAWQFHLFCAMSDGVMSVKTDQSASNPIPIHFFTLVEYFEIGWLAYFKNSITNISMFQWAIMRKECTWNGLIKVKYITVSRFEKVKLTAANLQQQ